MPTSSISQSSIAKETLFIVSFGPIVIIVSTIYEQIHEALSSFSFKCKKILVLFILTLEEEKGASGEHVKWTPKKM
ncbi:MAG: hypothetical protein ACLFU9_05325 [Candidatus Bathyarchaeia archaeon]